MIEFRILGPLEVSDEGRPVALQGTKQRALLAVLLLHAGEVVSSDRLIDDLWGAEAPESGVAALQVRVSQLRKTLGDASTSVETRSPGYVLRVEPDSLDLARFERLAATAADAEPVRAAEMLREALALWRGPPLAEFAYETFAQPAIARLEELRLTVLERRIEVDLALGRHEQLVGELQALVLEHPLRERLRAQLMLALYRGGRQPEALEVYQSTRRTLIDILGIDPTPALQELEKAILRQEAALDLTDLPTTERSLLVVSRDTDTLAALLELAEPLGRRPLKELILTHLVATADDLGPAAAILNGHRARLIASGQPARAAAFVSRTTAADIVRIATEQDVDLVLVDGSADVLADPVIKSILADSPCDVAVMVGRVARAGPIVVPFVGAEHDWTAVELAAWLARSLDERLLFAGPREGPGGRDASRLLASASLAVQRALGVAAEPLLLEPGLEALLAAAQDAGVVVFGLSDRWRKDGIGAVRTAVAKGSPAPVLFVRRGLRPGGIAPQASLTRFTWSLRA